MRSLQVHVGDFDYCIATWLRVGAVYDLNLRLIRRYRNKCTDCGALLYLSCSATKLSKDRKLWSSSRPSLRCQPLSEGAAIK